MIEKGKNTKVKRHINEGESFQSFERGEFIRQGYLEKALTSRNNCGHRNIGENVGWVERIAWKTISGETY